MMLIMHSIAGRHCGITTQAVRHNSTENNTSSTTAQWHTKANGPTARRLLRDTFRHDATGGARQRCPMFCRHFADYMHYDYAMLAIA